MAPTARYGDCPHAARRLLRRVHADYGAGRQQSTGRQRVDDERRTEQRCERGGTFGNCCRSRISATI